MSEKQFPKFEFKKYVLSFLCSEMYVFVSIVIFFVDIVFPTLRSNAYIRTKTVSVQPPPPRSPSPPPPLSSSIGEFYWPQASNNKVPTNLVDIKKNLLAGKKTEVATLPREVYEALLQDLFKASQHGHLEVVKMIMENFDMDLNNIKVDDWTLFFAG